MESKDARIAELERANSLLKFRADRYIYVNKIKNIEYENFRTN